MGASLDLSQIPAEVQAFLTERHLATLTTLRRNGSPHVVPVGFTWEPATRLARIITSGDSVKVHNAERGGAVAALCQLDRARWLTLSGPVRVERDSTAVRDAEERYALRYRAPRTNPKRVVLVLAIDRILASTGFRQDQSQASAGT